MGNKKCGGGAGGPSCGIILVVPEDDILDDRDFYELMQNYRHSPLVLQHETVAGFEAVKRFIRKNLKHIRDDSND
jgi:hypothetical protein